MEAQFNTNQIYLLMNEHSLSEFNKKEITQKLQKLTSFMNYLNTINTLDDTLKNELTALNNLLSIEQKTTARLIVSKNNLLSKSLIKSMANQKENLLQVLEISQLRLEAELKRLNATINYPAIKTEVSFFNKIFNLFRVPFKNINSSKKTSPINRTREKISLTTSKLNNLEKRKEDLVKEFGCTGNEALRYLNKITYNSFLPIYDTSNSHLENLKNKLSVLNN